MKPDFEKYTDGLVPTIVQDVATGKVLMLGYMNRAAYDQTMATGKVTFYSRSKRRLWQKGETSGHFLYMRELFADCDADALLVKAVPAGPVCHTGADTCFGEHNTGGRFLDQLEQVIALRKEEGSNTTSYTAALFRKGISRIAQKVGEEAIELVIEAKDNNTELFKNEAADLLFHYLVLLRAKGYTLNDIEQVLQQRHAVKVNGG